MKQVSLEEKLLAQVKNILTVVQTPMPNSSKLMLLESQRVYLNAFIEDLMEQYKET
jgi:hypothetical protein